MKKIFLSILLVTFALQFNAQERLRAHSHNDYANIITFWLAYYNHFSSIEADIWLVNNELYVAHNMQDIKPERTFDALYLQPVVKLVKYNGGRPWHDFPSELQLLIDLKTEAVATLNLLTGKLKQYPEIFDQQINPHAVRIVISGNRPHPSAYSDYPSFIFFDGILGQNYNNCQLARIPLFSENLRNVISWDGKSTIAEPDRKRLVFIIDSIHAMGKNVRFWNAPDDPVSWDVLLKGGVDFVNTDHINQLADFLRTR